MTSILRLAVFLSLAFGSLSSPVANELPYAVGLAARAVNGDNLARCFKPTGTKAADSASRAAATAFCSSFLSVPVVTSTVATSTPITSITITTTLTASTETQTSVSTSDIQATEVSQTTITTTVPYLMKRLVTSSAVAPPKCASTALPAQFSSVCSGVSVTPSTTYITATAPLATDTAIQTSSITVTTATLTTLTEITGTTTTTSTAFATQTAQPACSQLANPYTAGGKSYTVDCDHIYDHYITLSIKANVAGLPDCLAFCSGINGCTNAIWISPANQYPQDYNKCYLTRIASSESGRYYHVGQHSGILIV